ncbi:MAG: YceI family protein [Burkholderiales bacterium]|nr:YceI family protein [Anaerolineae bacterium]
MNSRIVFVALAAAVIGGVIGVLGFTWVVGGSGAASAPISAPTLDVNAMPTLNPTQAFAAVTQVAELNEQVTNLQSTIDAMSASAASVQALTDELEATAVPTEAVETAADASAIEAAERALYRIDPANSLAMFELQEDLRGVRTDVIGTTSEVAGDIILDFANPEASQIGTIRINARTLATDTEMRNRMLRSEILQSANDAYEYIEFVPTALNGLPDAVTLGETYTFDIVGDLTIAGQTNEVTFSAEVTPHSEDQLSGTAQTVVRFADWGINIPNVPQVANVTEDVTLTLDFTAQQVAA